MHRPRAGPAHTTSASAHHRGHPRVRRPLADARSGRRHGGVHGRSDEAPTLPIRIVFLAQAPRDWWCMHTLYDACRADPRFEVAVVSIGWGPWMGIASDCDALFGAIGIEAIDGRGSDGMLARLRPDVIVVSSPYDMFRDPAYRSTRLASHGRILYIPYGIDFGDASGRMSAFWFGQPIMRLAWRILASSPARVEDRVADAGVTSSRVVGLGLPLTDMVHHRRDRATAPAARSDADDRLRLLYTPHHELREWSTFLENGPVLRRIVERDDRLSLFFRPHPGLGPKLDEEEGIMGRDAFVRSMGTARVLLDESDDYFEVLDRADAIVSDASSMLFIYAPTGRPLVYLERSGGAGLDPRTQAWVSDACYVVRSPSALEGTIERLLDGDDPLARSRRRALASHPAFDFSDGAGARVARYLVSELA